MPYNILVVGHEELKCPVCHQQFRTNHRLGRHMDVHKGMGYPCSRCHKPLSSRKMLRQHEASCKEGRRFTCGTCGKDYASAQIVKAHEKFHHGAAHPQPHPQPGQSFPCPHCAKVYQVKKSMREHVSTCFQNPSCKGPYFCWVDGYTKARHPFQRVKT